MSGGVGGVWLSSWLSCVKSWVGVLSGAGHGIGLVVLDVCQGRVGFLFWVVIGLGCVCRVVVSGGGWFELAFVGRPGDTPVVFVDFIVALPAYEHHVVRVGGAAF